MFRYNAHVNNCMCDHKHRLYKIHTNLFKESILFVRFIFLLMCPFGLIIFIKCQATTPL